MSAVLDLPDARWDLVQLSGAWARENHVVDRRLRPGRQGVGSDRGASSHQHNPFIALRRATTTEEDGEAYGFSLVYSGNFIAEAEVDPYDTTRVRIGISPNTFSWHARARGGVRHARGGPRLLRRRARRDERRAPPALPRAPRPRHLARPAAAGPAQQLGGDLLRLRRDKLLAIATVGARPRRRAVRPRRRLVRRARRRHDLARRLVRRPAQAARRARRPRRRRSRRSAQVRPVDRARDGQPSGAGCSRRTRTGRSASRAGRGPRAASSSSSTCPGPRSSTTSSACCPRSWRARRSRTSSGT